MSDSVETIFGQPLGADASIALPKMTLPSPLKIGPLHKVQYVIEFVGPRSVLAIQACQLLEPSWYMALGQPQMWVMRPADLRWQPLTSATDGSYDSLALTWDLLSPAGQLSSAAATQLYLTADRLTHHLGRRPLPLPEPATVDSTVRTAIQTNELLDIGFAVTVVGHQDFAERAIWIEAARLGLEFAPDGSFEWRMHGHPSPLLSVVPFGDQDHFSLAHVQAGIRHTGVSIGFNMPRNAAPRQALDGALLVANHFAHALKGAIFTDDQRPFTPNDHRHLVQSLDQALLLFSQIGMVPGSAESLKLFPG